MSNALRIGLCFTLLFVGSLAKAQFRTGGVALEAAYVARTALAKDLKNEWKAAKIEAKIKGEEIPAKVWVGKKFVCGTLKLLSGFEKPPGNAATYYSHFLVPVYLIEADQEEINPKRMPYAVLKVGCETSILGLSREWARWDGPWETSCHVIN